MAVDLEEGPSVHSQIRNLFGLEARNAVRSVRSSTARLEGTVNGSIPRHGWLLLRSCSQIPSGAGQRWRCG